MLRFLTYILGARDYEPCKSCETLKQQLDLVNAEKKELTQTLLNLLKPQVIEAPPVIVQNAQPIASLWTKRRAVLEEKDRQQAKILKERQFVAVPDNAKEIPFKSGTNDVSELERELGIPSEKKEIV